MIDKRDSRRLPRISILLIKLLVHPAIRQRVMRDFEDLTDGLAQLHGKKHNWMVSQEILRSFWPLLGDRLYWSVSMTVSYLRVAWRSMMKQPMYSFITILGLAVGIAAFTLAGLYAHHHFSFDRHYPESDRIFHLVRHEQLDDGSIENEMRVPTTVYLQLQDKFPEVETLGRFIRLSRRLVSAGASVTGCYENRIFMASPDMISFLGLPVLHGDAAASLGRAHSVVITQSTALKYFSHENVVGKQLFVDGWDDALTVTAVIQDQPVKTVLQFNMLISTQGHAWTDHPEQTSLIYFRLKDQADPAALSQKINAMMAERMGADVDRPDSYSLFPLQDIHLGSVHIQSNYAPAVRMTYIFILLIGTMLLVIVAINFMNLATARYMGRVKEIGLRKVVGASRWQLAQQFMMEAVLASQAAFPLGLLIFALVKPLFLSTVNEPMKLDLFSEWPLLLILWAITLTVGLFSGSYPAWYLSKIDPRMIFAEMVPRGNKGQRFRKLLVVLQFSITLLLMTVTLLIQHQLGYLMKLDLGYDRSHVAVLPLHRSINEKLPVLEAALLEHSSIEAVGAANSYPFGWGHQSSVYSGPAGSEKGALLKLYHVGYGFMDVLNMPILQGRGFERGRCLGDEVVVSTSAAARLGFKDPLGQIVTIDGEKKRIVGVVADFHFNHFFFQKHPGVLLLRPEWNFQLFVRYRGVLSPELTQYINNAWKNLNQQVPFECQSLEDRFEESVGETFEIVSIFKGISVVGLFMAAMGLVGLAAFTTGSRIREIGIRKVLGASMSSITVKLMADFLKYVLIANVIGIPLAQGVIVMFARNAWVEDAPFSLSALVLAAALSLVTAMLAVGWQALRGAAQSPVVSLKHE